MDAKKYLERYVGDKKQIRACVTELQQEMEMFDDTAAIGVSDDVLKGMKDIIRSLSDELTGCLDEMRQIYNLVFSIPLQEGDVIYVMHLRYIQGKSWEEVSSEVTKSMRQVKRYHEEGLKMVQKILDARN